MPNLFLTNSFIYSLKCPAGKSQELYWDHPIALDGKVKSGAQKGLGIRVTDKGAKAYIHNVKFNGVRRRNVVGDPTNMNIESARLVVQHRNNQFDEGIDPEETKVNYREKHKLLMDEIIVQFYELHICKFSERHKIEFAKLIAPKVRSLKTPNGRRGANKRIYFDDFSKKYALWPVEKVRPQQIASFLDSISSNSVSNKAYSHLKAMFNWAIRMQLIDMRNPCDPISKRKIIKTRRDYSPEQIKAITSHVFSSPVKATEVLTGVGLERRNHALDIGRRTQQENQMQELYNFMGILLLTMARPNEVKTAKFSHFDLKQLIWHKHNTKGLKLSHAIYEYEFRSVPIHPKVAEIIKAQKERWPSSELVFPSTTDQTIPRDNFTKGVYRFKELDGVPQYFQLYDLKRIAISLMLTGQGVRREDISHYVDHKGNIETTMIYDLGFVDPMRPVAEKLGELLGVSEG